MKTFFTIIISVCSLITNVLAQDFKITDYTTNGINDSEKNELRGKWLGGSVSMVFFDRTVKFEKFFDGKGVEYTNMKFPILDKVDDNTYSFIDKKGKTVLKLEKWVGYIRSATVYIYDYREGHSNESVIIKLTRQ